jgi:hypothetical protein
MTTGTAHWSDRYIGLPYTKADCAELCARVQREQYGREVEIPSERGADLEANSHLLEANMLDFLELTDAPGEGDVVLMRCSGRLRHPGTLCLIGGDRYVLHALRNARQAVRHRLRDLHRYGLLPEQFYSWRV